MNPDVGQCLLGSLSGALSLRSAVLRGRQGGRSAVMSRRKVFGIPELVLPTTKNLAICWNIRKYLTVRGGEGLASICFEVRRIPARENPFSVPATVASRRTISREERSAK